MFQFLENSEPERVEDLLGKLPNRVQEHLRRLSLKNYDLTYLAGRLILIHGRDDTMIPYTESVALASAVPGSQLFLVDGFSHVDPTGVGLLGRLQLIDAVQEFLERRVE